MASTYLEKTFSTNGTSATKWTFSTWIKRSGVGVSTRIYTAGTSSRDGFVFNGNSQLQFFVGSNSPEVNAFVTNRTFRDVSAWYHIVISADSTQSGASNQVKLYVNGIEETSFAEQNAVSTNLTWHIGNAIRHRIGTDSATPNDYYNGSMAHVHFIDGTAYDASAFGETDATTGIWKPKTAPSVTYGTNGFFLKFENSGSMGTDSSGNGNNFTVNGTMTQTIDTPSNVFATLNPLFKFTTTAPTYSNGNLTILGNAGANTYANGTFMVSKGKWYFETKSTSNDVSIGVKIPNKYGAFNTSGDGYYGFYNYNGNKITDGVFSASQSAGASNDILQLALDMDNNKLWVGRNGTYFDSGNPSAGTNEFLSSLPTELVFSLQNYNTTTHTNFGNGYFGTTPVSSAENPDDGIGIFEFSPPTGYKSLCTKSLNSQEYD